MKKPAEDLAEIDSAPGDDPTLAAGPTATAGATAAAGTPTATEKAKAKPPSKKRRTTAGGQDCRDKGENAGASTNEVT